MWSLNYHEIQDKLSLFTWLHVLGRNFVIFVPIVYFLNFVQRFLKTGKTKLSKTLDSSSSVVGGHHVLIFGQISGSLNVGIQKSRPTILSKNVFFRKSILIFQYFKNLMFYWKKCTRWFKTIFGRIYKKIFFKSWPRAKTHFFIIWWPWSTVMIDSSENIYFLVWMGGLLFTGVQHVFISQ